MTFKEVLDEVINWLSKEERISYSALRRQFDLDDDYLEDVKESLFFGKHAVEEGAGLRAMPEQTVSKEAQEQVQENRFYPVLKALKILLHNERQISYREIKLIFGIDDAFLMELREELILKEIAADKDNKLLCWIDSPDFETSEIDTAPTTSDGVTNISSDIQNRSESESAYLDSAERRQLTVMFCDLAGSTALSQKLDPEILREVIRSYQSTAAEVINRYEGHIAQYLGDGLLIYFGWPKAHEDDPKRSLLSGLGIVKGVQEELNPILQQEKEIKLDIRIGIHTGPVVVGEMGGAGRHENLATGETVNIAARLESLAPENTVLISKSTERLVGDDFSLKNFGKQKLKGISDDIDTFEVIGLAASDRVKIADVPNQKRFMVGRDEEMGLLYRRWDQVKEGFGQVVLVNGTAGIGKSELVDTLNDYIKSQEFRSFTFRCSSYHRNSALFPVKMALERLAGFKDGDTTKQKSEKLRDYLHINTQPSNEIESSFASLLSLPARDEAHNNPPVSPQMQKLRMFDAFVQWLAEEAQNDAILVRWEDLHWADPSTLELLDLIVEQTPTIHMLFVLTFRPEFSAPWQNRSHITPITLNRLERIQIAALAIHHANEKELPKKVLEHIISKTDGVPLFVEELTKMLLESNLLQEEENRYVLKGPLEGMAIPETLQDSLMARLDQLNTAKEVAQVGSVLGREFSFELLEAVWSTDKEVLRNGLTQLVEAEMFYRRGRPPKATYIFRHALIQDTAYASLLKRKRQNIHKRAAESLETKFPEINQNQPELVANHYTEALDFLKSIPHWQRAGELAAQNSAYEEATVHLSKGLEVLKNIPKSKNRDLLELELQTTLGPSLLKVRGFASPEVGALYLRAKELSIQTNKKSKLFSVLFGLVSYYVVRAENSKAQKVAEETRDETVGIQNPVYGCALGSIGMAFYGLARFKPAIKSLQEGISVYDRSHHKEHIQLYGTDLSVFYRGFVAHSLWHLGYPDQALVVSQQAIDLATEMNHPFTEGVANAYTSMLHQFRREVQQTDKYTQKTIELSTEHQFIYYLSWAKILRGWVLSQKEQIQQGRKEIREGLKAFEENGTQRSIPYYLSLLAQIEGNNGNPDEGLNIISTAIEMGDRIDEFWWIAELHRVKGELYLLKSSTNLENAMTCFQRAIDIAKSRLAKSLELRATTSMARVFHLHNRSKEALEILHPVYSWFTEGFDTYDLIQSKKLLDQLST